MSGEIALPAGLHIVAKPRAGKPPMWYVYAWRGGPCIHKQEAIRPKLTQELVSAAAEAFRQRTRAPKDQLSGLIAGFRASPEWGKLSPTTTPTWLLWLQRIGDEFGDLPLEALEDRRVRGDILEWRDRWAHQPRSADMAIQVFSRLLSWGVDRGRIALNVLHGTTKLYEFDRSEIIWEPRHFESFAAHASAEVREAVDLAACTGLRRGDLVKLPWSAIGENAILWKTGKSRGKARIAIPILPETRALLDRIRARYEAEMAARRPSRRKPAPPTVLASSRWTSWTVSGFASRFNDAKQASGIDVNLHDLRGTFATRCMIAGLTDDEIGNILGWSPKDVAVIRAKYVDQARVVIAIGERLAAKKGEHL